MLPPPSGDLLQDSSDEAVVARLVEEITQRIETGQPVDLATYLDEYPQYADELRETVLALQALGDLGAAAVGTTLLAGAEADDPSSSGSTLGDFRIVREIACGGMGAVYEAEQLSLGRRVAIKVLPFGGLFSQRQLDRFKNESRAAASLHHSNIVPIYSVGCDRGVHFVTVYGI